MPGSDVSARQYVNIDSDQPMEEAMTEEQIIEFVAEVEEPQERRKLTNLFLRFFFHTHA